MVLASSYCECCITGGFFEEEGPSKITPMLIKASDVELAIEVSVLVLQGRSVPLYCSYLNRENPLPQLILKFLQKSSVYLYTRPQSIEQMTALFISIVS